MMANKDKLNKEALQEELKDVEAKEQKTVKMGAKLKQLLKKDIEDFKKREKTRGAEMNSIFAAHNYYSNGFTPVELRTTLEDLGPTYVKIGQIMSSRADLLPEAYCKELEKLRQNVKPFGADVARAIIEEETGKKIDEIFSEFRDEPLGAASMGQIHYAVRTDGTAVVVKVQRPLIADMMRKDYALLKKLAGLVNVVVDDEDGQTIDLVSVIEEMEAVTEEELNCLVEANNTKIFKENCIEDEEKITCPSIHDDLTTEKILTMDYVDGYTVSHKDKMIEDGYDPLAIGQTIAESFIHQVFDVGSFHADPHQGNIMLSNGKPYWIDFGMIGHISDKSIDSIQTIVLALLSGDAEDLVNGIFTLASTTSKTSRDKLTEDAEFFISKYAGVKGVGDLDMGVLFNEITDMCSNNHMSIPGEYTMLGRALIAIEGVIEQLCPDLDLFKLLSDKMIERNKQAFDIKETILNLGKDLLGTGKKLGKIPSLTADALNVLAKGKMKMNIELTGVDEPLERIGVYVKYVVLALIACVLFIGSCILASVDIQPKTENGLPLIAVVGIVFAIALAIYSIGKLTKKK